MEKEVNKKRKEIINYLKEEKITGIEWEIIRDYIDEMYESIKNNSTL